MYQARFPNTELRAIMESQPEDYFPRMLEELTNVSKSLANVRLQYWRDGLKQGSLSVPAETSPDKARGPKLILLSAPESRMAAVAFTTESLHEYRQRMLKRQRAVSSGRDKEVRSLRVIQEPDHTIEILQVLNPEDSRDAHMRARREQTDRLRLENWHMVTDAAIKGGGGLQTMVHTFYRILRTIPTDPRCYVGRTTKDVRTRIALHCDLMGTKQYASHQIMTDGQWTYEVLCAFRLPSVREANEIEARLIARYPQAVNLEYTVRRANVIGTERDPYYGMDINDVAVALGGEVVTPIAPLAAAERTSE